MKHFFSFITLLFFSITIFAQIPDGYYDDAAGLEGEDLREALKSIITSGHSTNSYDDLYDYYESTDNYGSNKVWDMYSLRCDGTADYWFYFNSDNECGTYSVEGDCYNREHSAPQSWFDSNYPMEADLFIVYPTDGKVNGMRSNYPYGETDGKSTSSNGSKVGSCTYPGYTGTVFEPIDCFKGDFARTYFYIATRYKDQVESWTGNADYVFTGDNLSSWQINMLLEWDDLDPVSQKEIDRNDAVYDIQGNRNPYIDHPEWVECVWATCTGLNFTSAPVTSAMENQAYTYNITYNVDTDTETITGTTIPAWLTFTKDEANNKATLSGTPSNSDIGDHDVVITLAEGEETKTQSFTITVEPYSNTQDILDVDFSSCPPAGWETVSVASNEDWQCNSGTYSVNGYGGDVASEDWFISPEINLDDYENEVLTFKTWTKYSDDGITDPEVKLFYTTNYTGSPSSTSWTSLSYTFPTVDNQEVWTESGDIDLSSINGTAIRIAYKYESSGTASGECAYWQIDDVLLKGDIPESVSSNINSKIDIYPNPTNQIINISSSNIIKDINIYSVIGQKMLSFNEINKNNYSVNLSKFTKGVYFIEVKDINNTVTLKKLIKE